jgi:hypothetical protein
MAPCSHEPIADPHRGAARHAGGGLEALCRHSFASRRAHATIPVRTAASSTVQGEGKGPSGQKDPPGKNTFLHPVSVSATAGYSRR